MNRLILILYSFIFSLPVISQHYVPDDRESKVHFTIKNFGINTGGALSNLKGQIIFDSQNLSTAIFDVTVDVNTIDTDNDTRDGHLRSERYFDAEKYPVIAMKSTSVTSTNKQGEYTFSGVLSMHGVSKPISFLFTATQQGNDYLFKGNFELNRLDYGVGETSAVLSRTVAISLSVLARKS
jgi:polyisoprenoid-binding protein YceI